jgi:hypothetical protein
VAAGELSKKNNGEQQLRHANITPVSAGQAAPETGTASGVVSAFKPVPGQIRSHAASSFACRPVLMARRWSRAPCAALKWPSIPKFLRREPHGAIEIGGDAR